MATAALSSKMIQLNLTAIWKQFSQYIFNKYMLLMNVLSSVFRLRVNSNSDISVLCLTGTVR